MEEKVLAVIRKELTWVTPGEMTPTADLVKDLGADSLDFEMIRCDLEAEFDIDINDEEIATVKTVGDAVRTVERLVKQAEEFQREVR